MQSKQKLMFSVSIGLFGLSTPSRLMAEPLKLPYFEDFSETNGITWLHLSGEPMSRRYIIEPGHYRHCTFEVEQYQCQYRPCEGETFLQIKVSYYDPSMNEDDGVISEYLQLDWKPTAGVTSPFQPVAPWESVTSHGHTKTKVSYLPQQNATIVFQKNTFMMYNYTWAKIVTNSTYDQVESVHISNDTDQHSSEENRWTVLDCKNAPK